MGSGRARSERKGRRARRASDDVDAPPVPRRRWRSSLIALALLLLIPYATLLIVSRTPGFRALFEQRLEGALGLTWHVAAVRATPALALRMRGIEARDPGAEAQTAAALSLREAEVRLCPRALLRGRLRPRALHVRDGRVHFTADDGGWAPSALAAHAAWADAWGGLGLERAPPDEPSAAPAAGDRPVARDAAPSFAVHAREIDVAWLEADGRRHAGIHGLRLDLVPLLSGDRRFTHIRLSAAEWEGARGERLRQVEAELLVLGRRRWLLAFDAGALSEP